MHRFFAPPSACQGDSVMLCEEESHHALHVMRVRLGERAVVLDGAGSEYLCEVTETSRHEVVMAIRQRSTIPQLPWQIVLLQGMPKGKSMDMVIQKATELGVRRVVPILAERTVAQVADEDAPRKTERWQAIAVESIKQCGSPWLPQIEPPSGLPAFLARGEKFDLTLLASLQPSRRHPRECFLNYLAEQRRAPRSVAVWVGPEGDFTPAEIHTIKAAGALPITLGPLVLRSETAAIYCLSVLSYELQWRAA